MKRPEFTIEQEYWICEELGHWYYEWKEKMTDNHEPHRLGRAMDQLKRRLCGEPINTPLDKLIDENI